MESALMKRVSGAPCGVRSTILSRGQRFVRPAVPQKSDVKTSGPAEEIYIGFEKEDGFGSRDGRKGRVIKDDPRKYPSRDEFGTGGWAGGEAGLWQFRDQAKKELSNKTPNKSVLKNVSLPKNVPAGKDVIYVGFGKDELDLRKAGAKGRIVVDDPKKYPGKDDIGPLAGVIGGFAGGEAGLKQYVATGEVRLRQPGDPGRRQFSPLTIAGLVALTGAVGGLLLDLVTDAGAN